MRTADIRAFVILQPQPMQAVDKLLFRPGYETFLVGIFDTQDESAAVMTCQQERIQRRSGRAKMHPPGV